MGTIERQIAAVKANKHFAIFFLSIDRTVLRLSFVHFGSHVFRLGFRSLISSCNTYG